MVLLTPSITPRDRDMASIGQHRKSVLVREIKSLQEFPIALLEVAQLARGERLRFSSGSVSSHLRGLNLLDPAAKDGEPKLHRDAKAVILNHVVGDGTDIGVVQTD